MTLPAGLSDYQMVFSRGDQHAGDGDSEEVQPFNSKFTDIKEIWQDGELLTTTKSKDQFRQSRKSKKQYGEYSLLLRRVLDLNERRKPVLQLELQSETLRQAFRKIAQGLGVNTISLSQDPITIYQPYPELYHCRDQIKAAVAADTTDEQTRKELQLLIDFETQYMAETTSVIRAFKTSQTIEFEWLWSLFRPGCDVVVQNNSAAATPIEWCARLKSFKVSEDSNGLCWTITVQHTAFNGQWFGRGETDFRFPAFSGTVPIAQLLAYPLEYHQQKDLLIDAAVECGDKYEKYCRASAKGAKPPVGTTMVCNGLFWTMRDESGRGLRMHDNPSQTINGRVMIDAEGFFSHYPMCRDTPVPETTARDGSQNPDYDSSDSSSIDRHRFSLRRSRQYRRRTTNSSMAISAHVEPTPLTNDQLRTCSPFIHAFSLSARAWGLVLVRELEIVDWNKEAYKKLQIDDEIKTTIYQVVRGHSAHANDFDDFIRGKGRGLVFLLHGPPGCGKTMTAESIADSLRRPLYSVNGGELGTSPTTIQNALEGIFELVSRWDAIFLLDEADAFLSKRSNSVEKNAPISVFLRVLEYQAGVIFLTTNRLPDIDDAFHSRIHASIAYAPLDAEKTRAIWKELAFEKCGYRLSDDEVAELVALTMDGRTIKNVLRLAVLFAKARGEEEDMTFGDIKAVLPLLARAGVVRGPGG